MGIRFKLIMPILIAFLIFSGILHYYWAPKVYENAKNEFMTHTRKEFSVMEGDLIRNILARDFSALFASLDRQVEQNKGLWVNLILYDDTGQPIYPLFPKDSRKANHEFYLPLRYSLDLEGSKLGYITVYLDWNKKFQDTKQQIAELEKFMIVTVLFIFVFVLYLQNRFVRTPLLSLLLATEHMSEGNFKVQLPRVSGDEMGQLTRAFDVMRQKIVTAHEENLAITEAKEAAAKAKLLEAKRTELVMESTSVALWDWQVASEQILLSERWAAMLGYKLEELTPVTVQTWQALIHDDDHDCLKKMLDNHSHGEQERFVCEYRMRHRGGYHIWVLLNGKVVQRDESGRPARIMGTHLDITERKNAELELLQAKDDAEAANKAKSEFLASMSHEIRTPMNGVLGMLSLLQDSKLDKEQLHRVELAQGSANALLTILNDILDFSKIDANKLELESLDFDLSVMLGSFAESMALQVNEKDIEIIVDTSAIEQPMVKTDPGRIRQILTNLVGNAIKFTEQGEIIISAQLLPDNNKAGVQQLLCRVSDTGIGIPADKTNKLFDLFSQVDASTTRKFGGTGLGLTIARKLCNMMGGDISVTSKPGQGSCFEFTVLVETSEHTQVPVPMDISSLNVLLVDDNDRCLKIIREQLQHWGAIIDIADSARSALALCAARVQLQDKPFYDLALVDMYMPEMGGIELGKALMMEPAYRSMKLVLMTAMQDINEAEYFLSLGFTGYFPKPVTVSDLFDALALATGGLVSGEQQTMPFASPQPVADKPEPTQAQITKGSTEVLWPDDARLLLVEDNAVNQMVAKGILNRFGLQPEIVANGVEALAALQQAVEDKPFTIVLMDCQMPEMDGYEASREIRAGKAGDRYIHIPIIALTANAMQGDKEKCLDAGMNDYLSKPINREQVHNKLLEWLTDNNKPIKNAM